MAEQETAPAVADASAPAEKPATSETVPYSRFAEVNEGYQSLKAELEATKQSLREREEAEMSAAEREKAARERAEQERDSAKAQSQRYERGRLVAEAARQANFNNPELAAEMLAKDGEIDSEAKAAKAVERLAKREPGLVKQESAPPELGRVIENGQPVDPTNVGEAQAKKRFEDDLREAVGFPTG